MAQFQVIMKTTKRKLFLPEEEGTERWNLSVRNLFPMINNPALPSRKQWSPNTNLDTFMDVVGSSWICQEPMIEAGDHRWLCCRFFRRFVCHTILSRCMQQEDSWVNSSLALWWADFDIELSRMFRLFGLSRDRQTSQNCIHSLLYLNQLVVIVTWLVKFIFAKCFHDKNHDQRRCLSGRVDNYIWGMQHSCFKHTTMILRRVCRAKIPTKLQSMHCCFALYAAPLQKYIKMSLCLLIGSFLQIFCKCIVFSPLL